MRSRNRSAQGQAPNARPDCEHWMELLQDLPDLRWAKVAQARDKIVAHLYEGDDYVEGVLPSVAREVGVVLREDTSEGAAWSCPVVPAHPPRPQSDSE